MIKYQFKIRKNNNKLLSECFKINNKKTKLLLENNNFLRPLKNIQFAGAHIVEPEKGKTILSRNSEIYCKELKKNIFITPLIKRHFEAKSKKEREKRYGKIKFFLQTLRFPQEIWKDPSNGRLTFVSQFQYEYNGKQKILSMIVIVVKSMEVLTYYSYFDNPNEINRYRRGILLFPKEKI